MSWAPVRNSQYPFSVPKCCIILSHFYGVVLHHRRYPPSLRSILGLWYTYGILGIFREVCKGQKMNPPPEMVDHYVPKPQLMPYDTSRYECPYVDPV